MAESNCTGTVEEVNPNSQGPATITPIPQETQYDGVILAQNRPQIVDNNLPTVEDISDENLVDLEQLENAENCPQEADTICDQTQPEYLSPSQNTSLTTKAFSVPVSWLKSNPVTRMRLFGQLKQKMSRLIGEGYLRQDEDGYVELVENPPVRATRLFHFFNRNNINEKTLLGSPMPAEYDAVADENGNIYLQRGLPDRKSVKQWDPDTGMHYHVPIEQMGGCIGDQLTESSELELIGIQPLVPGDDRNKQRCFQRLLGSGMLVFERRPSVATTLGCEGEQQQIITSQTTVAKFIPNPVHTSQTKWVLTYGPNGHEWIDVAKDETFRGPQGLKGDKGDTGNVGPIGETGPRGGVDCEVSCPEQVITGIARLAGDPDDGGASGVYYNTSTNTTMQWNGSSYTPVDTTNPPTPPNVPDYPNDPDYPTEDVPVYYNTTENEVRYWNGTEYVAITDCPPNQIYTYDSDPVDNGASGVYYNTIDNEFRYWNGTQYQALPNGVPVHSSEPVFDGTNFVYYDTTANTLREWDGAEYVDVDAGITQLAGDPLDSGATGVYFNTTTNTLRVWNGMSYVEIGQEGIVQLSSDPSDIGETGAYYNTSMNIVRYWNGTNYQSVSNINVYSSDPSNTTANPVYYNSSTNAFRYWDGTSYVEVNPPTPS